MNSKYYVQLAWVKFNDDIVFDLSLIQVDLIPMQRLQSQKKTQATE